MYQCTVDHSSKMMQRLALLLVCLALANGSRNPAAGKPWTWKSRMPVVQPNGSIGRSSRIVGGEEAKPHSWPHQVGLFIDGMYFCGGSIISEEWILTAAHCADDARNIEVVMGAHNVQVDEETQVTMTSSDYFVHERWDPNTIFDDIAVIRLPEKITFNENIQAVGLPSSDLQVGDEVIATGWGKDSDSIFGGITDHLNQVTDTVISNADCEAVYGSTIYGGIVCTSTKGGHGTCNGDSGGPLNKDGKTYGITSFVASAGCDNGYPDGFTRVYEFLDWIEEKTGVTP